MTSVDLLDWMPIDCRCDWTWLNTDIFKPWTSLFTMILDKNDMVKMSYVSYVLESVARRADTLTMQDWQCFLMSSFIFCIQSICFVLPCSAPKIFFAMGFIASTRLDLSLLSNRKPQVFLLPSGYLGRGFTWRSLRRNPRDARCERNPGAPWWTPKNADGETFGWRCFSVFVFFLGRKTWVKQI